VRVKATRYISDGIPNGCEFDLPDGDGEILVQLGHAKKIPERRPTPAKAMGPGQGPRGGYRTREITAGTTKTATDTSTHQP
jgi:hypothetical protein